MDGLIGLSAPKTSDSAGVEMPGTAVVGGRADVGSGGAGSVVGPGDADVHAATTPARRTMATCLTSPFLCAAVTRAEVFGRDPTLVPRTSP